MDEIVSNSVVSDVPKVATVDAPGADSAKVVSGSADAPVATSPLRGKAAYKARRKERNPEASDEASDDDLFDDALSALSETQGKYDELAGGNKRLAELVSRDPKLAALLTMVSGENPKSVQYAVGKLFGRDLLEADDEGLEELEKGYQEHLQGLAHDREALEEASRNIEAYQGTLDKFGKDNKLSESDLDGLAGAVEKLAVDVLKGNISASFIEFVWKGLNYEKDVTDAAAAGEAEGRNKRVAPELKKMATVAPVGAATVDKGASERVRTSDMSMTRGRSHWDNLTDA